MGGPARTPPMHLGLSSRLSGSYSEMSSLSLSATQGQIPPFASTPLIGGAPSFLSQGGPSGVHTVPALSDMGPDVPGERWRMLVSIFLRLFLVDVGAERDSFLSQVIKKKQDFIWRWKKGKGGVKAG
jgi:hypothetical protein